MFVILIEENFDIKLTQLSLYDLAAGDQVHRPLSDASPLHHQHHTGQVPRPGQLPHRATLCRQGSFRYKPGSGGAPGWGVALTQLFSFKVSLDGILQNIRSLERGMEMAKKEFLVQDDSSVLKDFIKANSEQLEHLAKDSKTAQVCLRIYIKSKLC